MRRATSIHDTRHDIGPRHDIVGSRYRLGRVIRQSSTAGLYEATHRNGATAWIKIASSLEHADAIHTEAQIANALRSALVVRDDGMNEDGLPYLVIDPLVNGENLAEIRSSPTRRPRASLVAIGDAIVNAVSSVHETGYCLAEALDEESVVVLPSGKVALIGLDVIVPSTPEGIARDMAAVAQMTDALMTEGPSEGSRPRQEPARRASIAEIASDERPAPEARGRISPTTPLAVSVAAAQEGSMIAYLAAAPVEHMPSAPTGPRETVASPLVRIRELPRVVQAVSLSQEKKGGAGRSLAMGLGAVLALGLVLAGVVIFRGPTPTIRTSSAAPNVKPAKPVAVSVPAAIAVTPPPAAAAPSEAPIEFELDPAPVTSDAPLKPGLSGVLRTVGGEPGLRAFVDGKPVGVTPLAARIACGTRKIQLGSKLQPVVVPCGGERVLAVDGTGRWAIAP